MTHDLTRGKPETVVLKYTLPLLLSVVFQQIYTIADSIIVGNFAAHGEDALAAVGGSYSITMIYVAIAVGSNAGCSVVISQLFGAGQTERMKCAVSTTLISSVVLSVLLTAVGLVTSSPLMQLINTPENILSDSNLYLRIYIGGFIFLFIYNICTGIFTALGDSVTPLIFLIVSSVGNIVLDYIFVAVFHWDVAGVAWATFIAQGLAGVTALIVVLARLKKIKSGKYSLFSGKMLATVSRYAVPSILQQSFVSVGNIFVQSLVNSFGSSVMAGYSAAIKLNTFCVTSMATMGGGMSGFTAQNIGAGKSERVYKGLRGGMILAGAAAVVFSLVYALMPDTMISLFIPEKDITPEALLSGVQFLRIVAPFYVIVGAKIMCDGVLRGGGAMGSFMVATFTDLVLRVILAFVFTPIWGYTGIWMSWPVGWIVAAVLSVAFFFRGNWKRGKTA